MRVESSEGGGVGGVSCPTAIDCGFLAYASTTNYPLATTGGGYTGYSFVRVNHPGNGYRTHTFVSPAEAPDSPATDFPFAPVTNYEWHRGLLLEQVDYSSRRDTVRYLKNNYTVRQAQAVLGLKVGQNRFLQSDCQSDISDEVLLAGSRYQSFETVTEFQYLESRTERMYGSENVAQRVETATTYQYDPDHLQRTRVTTTDSEQRTQTTNYQYAADFTDNTYGSELLRENHMHSPVLEQTTEVKPPGGTARPTQRLTTTYTNPGGNIVPTTVQYHPTGSGEVQTTVYAYDDQGNVREATGPDGVPMAYVWGYNQTLPVAQVVGATFSQVEGQLGTDFHAGARGLSDTQAQQLRTTLKPAQVTIYTHDPLVGITSETDPNGRTTTYHYDALNRLDWIKNDEGHVVQKLEYQYAQP